MAAPLRVLVVDSNLREHKERFLAALPEGTDVVWQPRFVEEAVVSSLAGVDVLVSTRLNARMAAAADRLRLVHVTGVGYDAVDQGALPAGVTVCNTGHHERSIAEYVAATAVVMRRRLFIQDRELRKGHWASSVYEAELAQPSTIAESTVGIVGFGGIGQATWSVLRELGAEGVAVTRSAAAGATAEGMNWVRGTDALPDLLTAADVVVLCLPLNDQTRHLIGADQLAMMKPTSLLVNVGRGPLVDPAALFEALDSRWIGGAVIDVWYSYPSAGAFAEPAPQPFHTLDNVFMTPHISGVTSATFAGRVADITANITRLAAGEPLTNVVIQT